MTEFEKLCTHVARLDEQIAEYQQLVSTQQQHLDELRAKRARIDSLIDAAAGQTESVPTDATTSSGFREAEIGRRLAVLNREIFEIGAAVSAQLRRRQRVEKRIEERERLIGELSDPSRERCRDHVVKRVLDTLDEWDREIAAAVGRVGLPISPCPD